jgi:ribosomal protein S18 acetylase RimI-like enzyme
MGDSGYALVEAERPLHFEAARGLFEEYAAQLGVDLCFQGFASELTRLSDMYGPPSGCLLLIMSAGVAVGCGAVRSFAPKACEMKRLYIRPSARGASLGRCMAESLVQRARSLGYEKMLLDTLPGMLAAQSLYRSLGFQETAPYYDNPLSNAVYMKLDL